jgi:hypothetical protein
VSFGLSFGKGKQQQDFATPALPTTSLQSSKTGRAVQSSSSCTYMGWEPQAQVAKEVAHFEAEKPPAGVRVLSLDDVEF